MMNIKYTRIKLTAGEKVDSEEDIKTISVYMVRLLKKQYKRSRRSTLIQIMHT